MSASAESPLHNLTGRDRLRALVSPDALPAHVRRGLFGDLFSHASLVHGLAVVVALFLGTFAWQHMARPLAPAWTGAMVVLEAGVLALVQAYRSLGATEYQRERWIGTYLVLNHLISLLWAAAVVHFVVPGLWVESTLVVVLIMGVVAGALLPFSYYYPLYLVLCVAVGLASVGTLAWYAGARPIYALMAALLAIVMPTLMRLSRMTYNQHVDALAYRVRVAELDGRDGGAEPRGGEGDCDSLTGLRNLASFLSAGRAPDGAGEAQVLALDLDRFDLINRALGLSAGDYVLRTIAQRLDAVVGGEGLVSRIAADEFAILLPRRPGIGAAQMPHRLQRAIGRPIAWLGEELVLTASIGLARMPEDAGDIEASLQAAISAMKASKREQRGQIRRYSPELGELERLEKRLELELALAERRDELFLAYQPKVRVRDGSVVGAEALARWQNEALGHVSPGDFIPVAEKTGQIGRIGVWALRAACQEALSWPAGLTVAVNVSAVQFREVSFAELVERTLEETGLPASRLELEVTESAIMASPDRVRDNLQRLRKLGVTLALDDFGTGYSSISHLRDLPVDVIKLDRSFVSGLHEDYQKRSIVRAAVSLCRDLGIDVVAEGVERPEEASMLAEFGCELAQGFLWSVPLSPERFRAYANWHMQGASPEGPP